MLEAKNLDKEISIKKIDNETANIKIFNNNILMAIVGEFNKNLIQLEKLTKTNLFFRGNSITVKGSKTSVVNVSNSLMLLVNKYLVTNSIENNDIVSIQTLSQGEFESASRKPILDKILKANLFPLIRQRPFNKVADPKDIPRDIFISGHNQSAFWCVH